MRELFGKRRAWLQRSPVSKLASDLARQPRLAHSAPRPIITASAPDMSSAVTAFSNEVMSPLTMSGTVTASLDGAHRAPIRFAFVELAARAPVHRNHLYAGSFGAAR